jgi:hypothetical protein
MATHSFVVERGFTISTPLGEVIIIDIVYKGIGIHIDRLKLGVDLIPLEL